MRWSRWQAVCALACAALAAAGPPGPAGPLSRALGGARRAVDALGHRIKNARHREVCYDDVGCFQVPQSHSTLRKLPEDPKTLATEFYLFRRDQPTPDTLTYADDLKSLRRSKFDPWKPVKIIIHGYMTRWNETGALAAVHAYLKEDCNMILMNWERAANGPKYVTAASNTELVGRQLGLLLMDMVALGTDPEHLHLIGFSLGAHVAACASDLLKTNGLLLARITGLDPASPLFRNDHLRNTDLKLDETDARFVDVVHTDGSPNLSDGFGLLRPSGHLDIFPNGGEEQPGCSDLKHAVYASQRMAANLTRETACSHIRAYQYFLESIVNKARGGCCEMLTWGCAGGYKEFETGRCFPQPGDALGRLGEDAEGGGVMYLVTRSSSPFCGVQLQIAVRITAKTPPARGVLNVLVRNGDSVTNFRILCETLNILFRGEVLYNLSAAKHDLFHTNASKITAHLTYKPLELIEGRKRLLNSMIFTDRIVLKTIKGPKWSYCGPAEIVVDAKFSKSSPVQVELHQKDCY